MTLEQLTGAVPAYASDLKLNLLSALQQVELTPQQSWGTAVACAYASRNRTVYEAVLRAAEKQISSEAVQGAKAAAAIMGMNNIYFRFQHLVESEDYSAMRSRLRMNAKRAHGTDPVDFELWCTAVSAVNGCGQCIVAHERVLREKGVSPEAIASAIRIASVLHALAVLFDVEPAIAPTNS
jgi:alkyl hydroperoxide reductase subunit D